VKIGEKGKEFNLLGTDGKKHSLGEYSDKEAIVLFFTCNHCPYVKAYEDRIIALQNEFEAKGVQFIGINSNDSDKYPDDSYDEMIKRAKDKGFNYPYLRDEDQLVAKDYDAACTPEMFLLNKSRELSYQGKIDDNWKEPSAVIREYLREAIEAVLAGKPVAEPEQSAIGCSIKWR